MSAKGTHESVWGAVVAHGQEQGRTFDDFWVRLTTLWSAPAPADARELDTWRRARMFAVASQLQWLASHSADLEDEESVRGILAQLVALDEVMSELGEALFQRIGPTDG